MSWVSELFAFLTDVRKSKSSVEHFQTDCLYQWCSTFWPTGHMSGAGSGHGPDPMGSVNLWVGSNMRLAHGVISPM